MATLTPAEEVTAAPRRENETKQRQQQKNTQVTLPVTD